MQRVLQLIRVSQILFKKTKQTGFTLFKTLFYGDDTAIIF